MPASEGPLVGIRCVRRLIAAFVAILLAVFAVHAPGAISAAMSPDVVHDHAYDSHHHSGPDSYNITERGPPTADDEYAAHDAVGRWSRGASARPVELTPPATIAYARPTALVHGALPTAMPQKEVQRAHGDLSALVQPGVAAKTGDDLTRVGRWMGDDELVKMQKTGLVQEGGGGRTFVANPADPGAFPAGKGVFAEFNVPTNSLFPAGKPEWSVIPGPNVTTRLFGTPPRGMPPATCIVVVCRR